jgi:hypothetical protein
LEDLSDECPHELRFASEDQQCLACDLEDDCRWLNENDDFSPLSLRPIPGLVNALEAAITYVRGDAIAWGHASSCSCQVCEWLDKAQQLYDSIDLTFFVDEKNSQLQPEPIKPASYTSHTRRKQSVKNNLYRLTRARVRLIRSFQSE